MKRWCRPSGESITDTTTSPGHLECLSSRIPGSHLSHREQEVLQLLFAGKSNREIAEELEIKEATVKSHVSVILMRLNVADRTQAVVEGLKRGLVHL